MNRKIDQLRGCFLGAAAGDALGGCVREHTLEQIREEFGPEGIQGYYTDNGYAEISAHTQLALFTANGLLYGATRGAMRGVMAPYVGYLELAYGDWLSTQSYRRTGFRDGKPQGKHCCWLCWEEGLHRRHNPDRATLLALESGKTGTMDEPISAARSAAALSRSFPIGLYADPRRMERREAIRLGAESAALTHGDPMGFLPAAYLAGVMVSLCHEKPESFRSFWQKAIKDTEELFATQYPRQIKAISQALSQAEALADGELSPQEALEQLHPEDASGVLAGAMYITLKFPTDFDRGLVAAVNHSFDSAALGTVAGALLGAAVGTEGIPEFYLEPLELQEVMTELADDLFQGCSMTRDSRLFDDIWNRKYVECVKYM